MRSARGLLLAMVALAMIVAYPLAGWGVRTARALAAPTAATLSGTFVDSGQTFDDNVDGVALGDVDGDGDQDIFLATQTGNRVWLNQGGAQGGAPGNFVDSGQILGTEYGCHVVLADLDGDGDLDAFLITDQDAGNSIWLNQGRAQGGTQGIFALNGQPTGESDSSAVALGDVDGDGDIDAFVTRRAGRPNKVWLNDGDGQFADSGQTLGNGSSYDVRLGDLDGDGDLDAFVADASANTVWLNQGGAQGGTQGVFLNSGQALAGNFSISVALGDVDRDGDLDAITANISGGPDIWVNVGGKQGGTPGVFIVDRTLPLSSSRYVALSDVDGDGDLDIFIARQGPNAVWINQGGAQDGVTGSFVDSGQILGNAFSVKVALGDVDGDHDPDAVVANVLEQPARLWRNDGLAGLQALYRVRDELLATTPRGQRYASLFYAHNAEILSLLLQNPTLFAAAYETLTMWLPNLSALAAGEGAAATITETQTQAVDDFLTGLSDAGSPALQQTIAAARAALPPLATFTGQTMGEAYGAIFTPLRVYLPVIARGGAGGFASMAPRPAALSGEVCVAVCVLTGDCE